MRTEQTARLRTAIDKMATEMSRSDARKHCGHLTAFLKRVGADDGLRSAKEWGKDVATGSILKSKIDRWLKDGSSLSHIFWAYTPDEEDTFCYAKALGLRFLWTVDETADSLNMMRSYISHICAVPQLAKIPGFKGTESEAGLLVMVYHLIVQLLSIDYQGHDKVQLNVTELQGLGEDIEHWEKALKVFGAILKQTKVIYCLITGLSDLERKTGKKCENFLNVLFANTEPKETWFMFTTCGETPLFTKRVPKEYRFNANQALYAPEAGEDQRSH